jgi:hypothetical protein
MSDTPNPSEENFSPQLPENGLRAFETVWRFLEEDGLSPRRMGDKYMYHVSFTGRSAQFNCFAVVRPDLEQFMFYAVVPVKASPDVRPAVVEFITRANYGLRIGNFELDYSDGEIRFKTSLDFEGVELDPHLVQTMVHAVFVTVNHYLSGLMRVMYGGLTPAEAIIEVERDGDES